ncbi:MAG: DUF4159 domain-containing protein [Alphaproteobacteria bacterium]|nr:MAG: DUF4159 domain-containing protein [Alphaproteobacteria bacterium]
MLGFGALAFLNPWLLAALAALPVLWFLLRAIPPGPRRIPFPGVRLLLGLRDVEVTPERTPWWLLLLRIAALAAAIIAFAEPVLNPHQPMTGTRPVLIVRDGGWASAPDWAERQARVGELLDQAARAGRPVALVSLAEPPPAEAALPLSAAGDWLGRVEVMAPRPWAPDRAAWAEWFGRIRASVDIWWLTDGLAHDAAAAGALSGRLAAIGPTVAIGPPSPAIALRPARLSDGLLVAEAIRVPDPAPQGVQVVAVGTDPAGTERRLALAEATFAPGDGVAEVAFDMPLELRNRVTRLALATRPSAGGVTLTDAALRRRKVGLIAGADVHETAELLSPLHYLRQALVPTAELLEAALPDLIAAAPDVLILADIGTFAPEERAALEDWVRRGGLLVRFAGPRLARVAGSAGEDPLLPVRLRPGGGRIVGGTMSWGAPRTLRPFPSGSPFEGLPVPAGVTVTRQVMAEPAPELPDRTLAMLEDGTPLVTARAEGEGRVVLFHVTANADWSSLPLSGLFVQMLERLAISARTGAPTAEDLAGGPWIPQMLLDGFGRPAAVSGLPGVPGARLAEGRAGPDAPPGLYRNGDRVVAVNLTGPGAELAALTLPAAIGRETLGTTAETDLKPWLLMAAFLLLAADLVATLAVSGRLGPVRGLRRGAAAGPALAALLAALPRPAAAQQGGDEWAIRATRETVLAHVLTGDPRVDRITAAGLRGLSMVLASRTAIEPGEPMGVDVERDELAFFPMLYWPITESQPSPSPAAIARLNAYLRNGGMIVFDTRDADLGAGFGTGTPNGRVLQRIAAQLDIPPLEPLPEDHVLTRTFYLLQSFPGRHVTGRLWVEAAQDARQIEGQPFRNLNDGVSPVVIGANDWAAAWAVDEAGRPLLPVGRALGGDMQREMAFRFGVNLVMYVMTGNYKSDQVHVPALLERLGQ